MPQTNFTFQPWNVNVSYQKYDISTSSSVFYYATEDNSSADPTATNSFTALTWSRSNDIAHVTFTQTIAENFQPGSTIIVTSSPQPGLNYNGICLNAGNGWVEYLNTGWDDVGGSLSGSTVAATTHPAWTKNFFWIPSYSSEVTHSQSVIEAKLGDGYSQRTSSVINSNSLAWSLVFNERSDKEARALMNFIQDKGGVNYFTINFPISKLYNTANLKYLGKNLKHSISSFGLNNVQFDAVQAFDL